MKAIYLFLGLVCADPRFLYTKINGTFEAFSSLVTLQTNYLAIQDEYFPDTPIFDLNLATGHVTMSDEPVTKGGRNGDKVFGIYNDEYVVFGKNVVPIQVELDQDSMVTNLYSYLCLQTDDGPRGFLMSKNSPIYRSKCNEMDLYFKRPGEVEMGTKQVEKMDSGNHTELKKTRERARNWEIEKCARI